MPPCNLALLQCPCQSNHWTVFFNNSFHFREFYINGIHTVCSVSGLSSYRNDFETHPCHCVLVVHISLLYGYAAFCLSIHLLVDTWVIFSSGSRLLWTFSCGCLLLFILGKYKEVEWLGGMISVCLILLMVFICIFLMTNNVEYLFMCLLAICLFSLEKWLFKFFAYFAWGCLFCCCWYVGIFICSGYQSHQRYVVCKYFLLICGLSFYSVDSVPFYPIKFRFFKIVVKNI